MIYLIPQPVATPLMKDLYEEAFPEQERRPWEKEQQLIAEGRLQLCHIVLDNTFVGFVCYWQLPLFSFIEHFAVHPQARGGGMGTQVMQLLEAALESIVLEVEPPVTEQAIRRIIFYERLGYHTFKESYFQPSYSPDYPPLELRLMYKGLSSHIAEFTQVREQLYKHVYHQ
ncbi:GNAT family N-acetyltransferase [Chitinophaga sp. 30R24]|uniref:GNAT family N-acetyltransferase n=1 Tax=Chitinophaga sp. 30R24 TaxID=3248838 RepID=UPI003B8F0B90